MTEKIIQETTLINVHTFYCDKCNKFLLESQECDDGYYSSPDTLNINIQIYPYNFGGRLIFKGEMLCKECLEKRIKEIKENLIKIGFIEG